VTSGVRGSDSGGQRGKQKNCVGSLSVGELGRAELGGRRKRRGGGQGDLEHIREKRSDLGANRVLA
jgi:hypothetical protein